jgi:transposase
MRRFVEGVDCSQSTLFPECLEDWVDEENPARVIDVFVDELELGELGVQSGRTQGDGPALLSSRRAARALRLQLSESDPTEPPP